jgi:hypothetical protein
MASRNGRLSDEALRAAIARARRLSESEPEPYRSLAFRTILQYLLPYVGEAGDGHMNVPAPGLGLSEFLTARRVETHPDRVLAIAYYQERYSGGPPITTKDLAEAYQRGRLKRPQNFPDVIASLVRKGYLVEDGRRDGLKSWGISNSGIQHVERRL